MIYCDTSLLVAALTSERHTARAQDWLEAQAPGDLATSPWIEVEVASALAMKLRRGALDIPASQAAAVRWRTLRDQSMAMLPVRDRHYYLASLLVDAARANGVVVHGLDPGH